MPYLRSWYFEQLNSADWDRSLNEHEQILMALLDGDGALAEQLMSAHIRRTRKMVSGMPDDVFDEEHPDAQEGAEIREIRGQYT